MKMKMHSKRERDDNRNELEICRDKKNIRESYKSYNNGKGKYGNMFKFVVELIYSTVYLLASHCVYDL